MQSVQEIFFGFKLIFSSYIFTCFIIFFLKFFERIYLFISIWSFDKLVIFLYSHVTLNFSFYLQLIIVLVVAKNGYLKVFREVCI